MAKKKTIKKKKQKIPPIEGVYQIAIATAAEHFRAGNSEQRIVEIIKETFTKLTDANIQLVLHRASQSIADQFVRDRSSIVALHVKRYNQEIEKLMGTNEEDEALEQDEDESDDGGWKAEIERRKKRIYQLMTALDVLFAKEKVLQIHNKETQIRIYNKLNAKVKEKKAMFNLDGLSFEEKLEFLQLIQKAKKSDNELHSIIMSSEASEQTIEDAEVVSIETPNVEKIKQTNTKPKELPEPKKNLDDVTKKIQEAFAKKAAMEFKKKGAKKEAPIAKDYTKINKK